MKKKSSSKSKRKERKQPQKKPSKVEEDLKRANEIITRLQVQRKNSQNFSNILKSVKNKFEKHIEEYKNDVAGVTKKIHEASKNNKIQNQTVEQERETESNRSIDVDYDKTKKQKEDVNNLEQEQLFKIEQLRLRIESFKKKSTAELS